MTHRHQPAEPGKPRPLPPELAGVLAEVAPGGTPFRHRQHIHLAWVAVQRYGASRAPGVVADWIRHVAAYARAPQKYTGTMTLAWSGLVAHHVTAGPDGAACPPRMGCWSAISVTAPRCAAAAAATRLTG